MLPAINRMMTRAERIESTGVSGAISSMIRHLDRDTVILLILVVIAIARGVLYALVNPPLSSPDEIGHYDYLASLYQNGGSVIRGKEDGQPALYYWLSLPFFAPFAAQTSDLGIYAVVTGGVSFTAMTAVRLFSVAMTVATVPIAYQAARAVLPGNRFVCIGTAAFVALVPGYGWLGASINNDNLAKLLTSTVILLLLRAVNSGFTIRNGAALAALVTMGLATKPTTLPIAALVPIVFTVKFAYGRVSAKVAGIIMLILVAIFALLLVSPFGHFVTTPLAAFSNPWVTRGFISAGRVRTFLSNLDVWPFVYQFKSFWGSFSADSIQLPAAAYWLAAALTGAATIGLAVRGLRTWLSPTARAEFVAKRRQFTGQVMILVSLVVLEWMLSFGRFYGNEPLRPDQRIAGVWEDDFALMQGRFLYPVMVPIAFVFVWGLGALMPARWAKQAPWVLMAVLVLIDWSALLALAYGGHAWRIYPSPE